MVSVPNARSPQRRQVKPDRASRRCAVKACQGEAAAPIVYTAASPDGYGRCLRARRHAAVGEILLSETPAFVQALGASREESALDAVQALDCLTGVAREAVLDLFAPLEPLPGLEALDASLPSEKQRFLRTLHVNGIRLPSGGRALFVTASRANHSCRPNTAFRIEESGSLSLVALRPVEVGDEVNVSYIAEVDLLSPTLHRHRCLRPWGFTCACARCTAAYDDTREVRCPSCNEAAVRPTPQGHWQPCSACSVKPTVQALQQCETTWQQCYNRLLPSEGTELSGLRERRLQELHGVLAPPKSPRKLRRMGWMAETVRSYSELLAAAAPAPASDGHWLAARLADQAAEAHLWRGEYKKAAVAAQRRGRHIRRVFGSAPSYEAAIARGLEAVALGLAGKTERAAKLLRSALHDAELVRGRSSEFVQQARAQLRTLLGEA